MNINFRWSWVRCSALEGAIAQLGELRAGIHGSSLQIYPSSRAPLISGKRVVVGKIVASPLPCAG
jgi:hypothetical protein